MALVGTTICCVMMMMVVVVVVVMMAMTIPACPKRENPLEYLKTILETSIFGQEKAIKTIINAFQAKGTTARALHIAGYVHSNLHVPCVLAVSVSLI
jgi:hypothetical protein